MTRFRPLSRILFQSSVRLSSRLLCPSTPSVVTSCKMSDATPRFTLYMSGTSYYAQKVMMAFFEKNEPFVEKLVNQRADDNYESWFMKLNPIGKIPVLQDGSKIIPESDNIINYLDKEVPRGPRLVPDPSSELGQEVAKYRKLVDVDVGVLLHGLNYNPNMSPEPEAPGKSVKELDALIDEKIARLQKLASEHPDLKQEYLAKIPAVEKRKTFKDPKILQRTMDDLQLVFDEIEQRLQKPAQEGNISAIAQCDVQEAHQEKGRHRKDRKRAKT